MHLLLLKIIKNYYLIQKGSLPKKLSRKEQLLSEVKLKRELNEEVVLMEIQEQNMQNQDLEKQLNH